MSSSRFIKYIPSEKAKLLRKNHPNAYLLLSLIAETARVFEGMPDGLIPGDAILGDYQAAGLTRQKYRTAIDKLEQFGIIEKVHNGKKLLIDRKLTIKVTIGSMLVNLKDSDIWDINKILCNQHSNQRATNEQPTSNHKQERIRKNENEKEATTTPTPSVENSVAVAIYDCLKKEDMPEETKQIISQFPEKDVIHAIKFADSQKDYKVSRTATIRWAAKDRPEISKSQADERIQLAQEFNEWGRYYFGEDIYKENIENIKNGKLRAWHDAVHVISLKNDIKIVRMDIQQFKDELLTMKKGVLCGVS